MRKYSPSPKSNNECKSKVIEALTHMVYRLEQKKYNSALNPQDVQSVIERFRLLRNKLDDAIGTGEENIGTLCQSVMNQITVLEKKSKQSVNTYFMDAADDLEQTANNLIDVLNGYAVSDMSDESENKKIGFARKHLNDRLQELEEIKDAFIESNNRLEQELTSLEKGKTELDQKILKEDNERIINDFYRQVKASSSKIDILAARKANYSACFNLLDVIYANAKEMLKASDFSSEELSKVKALLRVEKLKEVIPEPDKAISILKMMESDVKNIVSHTKRLDEKVFGIETGEATVSSNALAYKEELMRKQREKEELEAVGNITTNNALNLTEESKNGIL